MLNNVVNKINLVNDYLVLLDSHLPFFLPVLVTALGMVFGSFLTCAVYRIPRGLSMWHPRSSCPSCKHVLTPLDLIPIFSYIFSAGKCRHCDEPVPRRYLYIEIFVTILSLTCFYFVGPSLVLLPALAITYMLEFVVFVYAFERKIAKKTLILALLLMFSLLFV